MNRFYILAVISYLLFYSITSNAGEGWTKFGPLEGIEAKADILVQTDTKDVYDKKTRELLPIPYDAEGHYVFKVTLRNTSSIGYHRVIITVTPEESVTTPDLQGRQFEIVLPADTKGSDDTSFEFQFNPRHAIKFELGGASTPLFTFNVTLAPSQLPTAFFGSFGTTNLGFGVGGPL